MTETSRIGFGAEFQRSDDGTPGGAFAPVGRLYNVTPPTIEVDQVEVTSHSSEEAWEEFIPGIKRSGEFVATWIFDPGDANATAFLAEIGTKGYYKLVFPDDTEWAFFANFRQIAPQTPIEDKMEAEVAWKLTGKPGFIA